MHQQADSDDEEAAEEEQEDKWADLTELAEGQIKQVLRNTSGVSFEDMLREAEEAANQRAETPAAKRMKQQGGGSGRKRP